MTGVGDGWGDMVFFSKMGVPHKLRLVMVNIFSIYGQYMVFGFPQIGVPPNGWFIKETPTKMDDLAVPIFQETTI